jgi:transcription antitermination factor NusG
MNHSHVSLNGEAMSCTLIQPGNSELAANCDEGQLRWYAVYTMAKHEKHVATQLVQKSIECFTPEYLVVHRWKDRTKKLNAPLFPCYTFVHMQRTQRVQVLTTAGVLSIVGAHHIASPVPDSEIEAIRIATALPGVLPHPFEMSTGDPVRVIRGPLAGLEGVVVRTKNNWRLVVAVETILRSISVEVQRDEVERCTPWHSVATPQ